MAAAAPWHCAQLLRNSRSPIARACGSAATCLRSIARYLSYSGLVFASTAALSFAAASADGSAGEPIAAPGARQMQRATLWSALIETACGIGATLHAELGHGHAAKFWIVATPHDS